MSEGFQILSCSLFQIQDWKAPHWQRHTQFTTLSQLYRELGITKEEGTSLTKTVTRFYVDLTFFRFPHRFLNGLEITRTPTSLVDINSFEMCSYTTRKSAE